ncbi:MAG: DRTGG domain-containing protein, partial [Thermodesulfobacteriota bacterium]
MKKKIVYVIGHRTPDTDSVCSAIGYAHFKNITDKGFIFMPARAGQLNEETRFVLERFNMPAPDEIESLAPTVSDLELSRPISVHERDSVHSLALLMREKGVRTAPVVNDAGRVAGIVGLRDIAHFYVGSAGLTDLTNAPISLDIFLRTMDGRVLSNARRVTELKGRVLIGSFQRGTLLNTINEGDIVVLGDQQDVQLELIKAGCGTLIITDGLPVGSETLKRAEQSGTLVISSPHPAFATVQFLLMSEPVSSIMSRSPVNVGL